MSEIPDDQRVTHYFRDESGRPESWDNAGSILGITNNVDG